jgi:hypothetical protein
MMFPVAMACSWVRHDIHAVPRAGSAPDAAEDAAAVRADTSPVRAAVADGATESVYAGRWARLLTEHLVAVEGESQEALSAATERARADWQAAVQEAAAEQPWYVQSKVADGAFAAVLSLWVGADGTWRAVSVGDCGLLQCRNGAVRQAWPQDDPDAFGHRPVLLSSRRDGSVPAPAGASGTWTPGDTFLLATDAVAAWLLRVGPSAALDDNQSFAAAVDAARADGVLRNDDATLLILTVTHPSGQDHSL